MCDLEVMQVAEIWIVPVPFAGTEEERRANRETHAFFEFMGEIRCGSCDARPSHTAASYPCGTEPPRMEIER